MPVSFGSSDSFFSHSTHLLIPFLNPISLNKLHEFYVFCINQNVVVIIHIRKNNRIITDKHKPSDEMIKDLDNLLSKLNAMEIVASDDHQKNSVKIMRALVEGQMHSINEFQHLKKAIDLVTLQLFDVQNKVKN